MCDITSCLSAAGSSGKEVVRGRQPCSAVAPSAVTGESESPDYC